MPPLTLTHNAITLKSLTEADFPTFARIHQDKTVCQYVAELTLNDITERFNERCGHYETHASGWLTLGVWFQGELIGFAGFYAEQNSAELGYLLDSPHWGKGLGTQVVQCLMDFAKQQGLSQLTATVSSTNVPSQIILQRLGFSQTHTQKHTVCIFGVWQDDVYFMKNSP